MESGPSDRCGAEWDPPWLDILREDDGPGPAKSTHEHCCYRETWGDRDRCWWHMDAEKSIDDLRSVADSEGCSLDQVPGARLETERNRERNARSPAGAGDGAYPMPTTLLCDAIAPGVELRENFDLDGAWLNGSDLSAANLKGVSLVEADVEAVDMRGATLRYADLRRADLRVDATGADFRDAKLDGAAACVAGLGYASLPRPAFANAYFRRATLTGADFSGADMTDARLRNADLSGANVEMAALERANLFDADLTGARLYGAVLGEAQINRGTTFFAGDDERCAYHPPDPTLRDRVGALLPWVSADRDQGEDDAFEKAAWTYRTIERLARQNSFPGRQRRMYIKRQRMETRMHARDDPLGLDHAFARVSQLFINHGEGPLRVLGWGAVVVLSFALLYPFGGWIQPVGPGGTLGDPITWPAIAERPVLLWESVYYSTLTFTNLGFGDFRPAGTIGQALTVAETGSGAVLLALLVFVLGRRAAR